jgi:hypothetical protein
MAAPQMVDAPTYAIDLCWQRARDGFHTLAFK